MSESLLPRSGILAFMDDESREQLAVYGSVLPAAPGMTVIQEGAEQTFLYIVLEGSFPVTTRGKDREVFLDVVTVGDCFGEVAIFQPGLASASVTCQEKGQLWGMEVGHLQQYLLDHPRDGCALILGINTILSRRLKRANDAIRANAIVPSFLSVRAQKRPTGGFVKTGPLGS